MALPTLAIPGANTVVGAGIIGGLQGLIQPTATGESRGANTVVAGGLGAGGQALGGRLAQMAGNRMTTQALATQADEARNAQRDAILQAGRQEGYVVPPTQTNPSLINQTLEGVSGKIKTGQVASQRNQPITNQLAARALGLPEDQPITREVLTDLRSNAGQAYEVARGLGIVKADPQYTNTLNQFAARFQGANKSFPGLAQDKVGELMAKLRVPQFEADSAVDAISVLRDIADEAYASGAKTLGKSARGASQALENMLERHAAKVGAPPDVVTGLREARATIAKSYSVERALNESGNVNAAKLAAQLKAKVPLEGELKTAAQFASTFPKAAQNIDQVGTVAATSPLDWYAALGTSVASGNPLPMALAGARPGLRQMLLSQPYQARAGAPNYQVPAVTRLADLLLRDGRGPTALRLLAPAAGTPFIGAE